MRERPPGQCVLTSLRLACSFEDGAGLLRILTL